MTTATQHSLAAVIRAELIRQADNWDTWIVIDAAGNVKFDGGTIEIAGLLDVIECAVAHRPEPETEHDSSGTP